MRLSSRRSDADADVIRARLRALLEDRAGGGWVPDGDDGFGDGELMWPEALPRSTAAHARVPLGEDRETGNIDSTGLPVGIGRHRAPGRVTRWDPGAGGARSLWLAGLLAALLLAVWTWLDRPRVEPAPPAPPGETLGAEAPAPPVGEAAETSEAVVVSVVGLVAAPGLVTLPAGARVADAVQAAGGLLPGADPASVNLAAVVTDGAQIAVGIPAGGVGPGGAVGGATGADGAGRLDLNRATAAELDALPGIGPVLAQRIVDHRGRNGPFRTVEQLDDVPGIGPATAAELADLVAV